MSYAWAALAVIRRLPTCVGREDIDYRFLGLVSARLRSCYSMR
jgi:hypothetical protein